MKRSGDILMTNQASRAKPLKIKYLKLVNHTISGRTAWSYADIKHGGEFDLHWAFNESQKNALIEPEREKALKRKRNDAKKLNPGDQILLFQNHLHYGHRATHVVEVVSDDLLEDHNCPARRVKIIRTPREPWSEHAPLKKVITDFAFRSGNLVRVAAQTVKLKLNLSEEAFRQNEMGAWD
jgi:hypothetical protein